MYHGGVNQHHQRYVDICPSYKLLYAWKHKVLAMIASLLKNCYINWINFKKLLGNMYIYCDFILEIINSLGMYFSIS